VEASVGPELVETLAAAANVYHIADNGRSILKIVFLATEFFLSHNLS